MHGTYNVKFQYSYFVSPRSMVFDIADVLKEIKI
jgi:hypothetical protein